LSEKTVTLTDSVRCSDLELTVTMRVHATGVLLVQVVVAAVGDAKEPEEQSLVHSYVNGSPSRSTASADTVVGSLTTSSALEAPTERRMGPMSG
jgi:hypothetical protein